MAFLRQSSSGFAELQKEHSWRAERERFRWLSSNPAIAALEEDLLRPVAETLEPSSTLLEIGCGEAGNLAALRRLRFRGAYIGCDFSSDKAAFSSTAAQGTVVGDALRLPFRDQAVDVVLMRDVLHHVSDRAQALREMLRVARERVWLIEPNPLSPVIMGFALISRAERGMLDSAPGRLQRTIAAVSGGWTATSTWAEPENLSRLILHYQFGAPSLGFLPAVARALGRIRRLATSLPRALWAYQRIEFTRSK